MCMLLWYIHALNSCSPLCKIQLSGVNVYPGVPHDYTKEVSNPLLKCHSLSHFWPCISSLSDQTVTPDNFLKVLTGESMNGTGSGKTLKRYVDPLFYIIILYRETSI